MSNKVYGYCRISRKEQNIDRQERNIKAEYQDAIILKEAFTGTKIEGRKEFEKLMKRAKAGDTIIFDSVSRMSRNAEEGIRQYMQWFDAGVNLVFLKEGYINTSVYASKLQQADISTGKRYLDEGLKVILMGLAEEQIHYAFKQAAKEVEDLHQRTREGIETARLAGKQIGQKQGSKLNVKKEKALKELIKKHSRDFDGTLSDANTLSVINGMDKITLEDGKTEIKPHIGLTKDGNPKARYLSRNTYYLYKRELTEELNA